MSNFLRKIERAGAGLLLAAGTTLGVTAVEMTVSTPTAYAADAGHCDGFPAGVANSEAQCNAAGGTWVVDALPSDSASADAPASSNPNTSTSSSTSVSPEMPASNTAPVASATSKAPEPVVTPGKPNQPGANASSKDVCTDAAGESRPEDCPPVTTPPVETTAPPTIAPTTPAPTSAAPTGGGTVPHQEAPNTGVDVSTGGAVVWGGLLGAAGLATAGSIVWAVRGRWSKKDGGFTNL